MSIAKRRTSASRPTKAITELREWRCSFCGKLLLKLSCSQGSHFYIETRCPKCGAFVAKEQAA